MKNENDRSVRRKSLISDLELESAFGYPKVVLCGDMSASVTGVCRIECYSKQEITMNLDKMAATFVGESLRLVYLTENAVRIDGKICGLSLERVHGRES